MTDRVDVGPLRRAQIVEAASRVIASKGFHNATLAEVESEAGISRGMMTYHFPTKDAMIQGVFDAAIERLRETIVARDPSTRGMEGVDRAIDASLVEDRSGQFACLHYTFLAQVTHRPDYRTPLAALYAAMRARFAEDLRDAGQSAASSRDIAAILVAAIHGLAAQHQVDQSAIDLRAVGLVLKTLARGN